ncbi:MAG: alpha/beta hydrolase, partial [Bacteroidia bacterium]
MQQKNIVIPKTARYFILGEASEKIEQVWFVCHGYGQLANYFIQNFHALNDGTQLIIAPEGLHRFYWKEFSGRVVASWMTKEDRTSDIIDYVNYLDMVYAEVLAPFKGKKIKVNVLGFSQGAATAGRWMANNRSHADNLIIWAGAFPADLDFEKQKTIFNSMDNFIFVVGDDDQFINEEEIEKQNQ